jgi:outer membrane protein OmpA-like peptidoglycan-associated protein
MKKNFLLLLVTVFILLLNFPAKPQVKDYSWKLGWGVSGLLPSTEFNTSPIKTSMMGRVFLRSEISPLFQVEFGGGYGRLAGMDYYGQFWESHLVPFDLRILLCPVNSDTWNPYLYVGAGGMWYKMLAYPAAISPLSVDSTGWSGYFPAGIGLEVDLGEGFNLDFNVGFNLTTTDNLNFYREGSPPDAFYHAGLALEFVNGGWNSDADKDGLTKREEKEFGTDPKNPDTDRDGLKDGDEVHKYMTNPLKFDTDGDGLSDGDEVMKYHTNPNTMDSDGDGLSDYDEVMKYKTDPNKSDTDGDGLSDGDEIQKYRTDPLNSDSDNDGLTDGDEVLKYNTDPNNPDSDKDGLTDGDEVFKYKTDPLKIDTDGGTVSDGTEVKRGTDPLNPDDDVVKVNVPIVLKGITFEFGKADIRPESEGTLQKALKTLNTHPDISVEIRGYTDNIGSRKYNLVLSQERAEAVMHWLIVHGVDSSRLSARGFGPDNPIASNSTDEGRAQNRRIEFVRIK